jgi:hypothetical protein
MRAGALSLAALASPLTLAASGLSPEIPAPESGGLPPSPIAMPMAAAVPTPPLPALVSVRVSAGLLSLNATLDERALDAYRGGTDLVSNDAHLSGLVGENAATNVSTGGNTIDGASFANVSGIPVVIQNSGANVLIQNSTIVNLQLK